MENKTVYMEIYKLVILTVIALLLFFINSKIVSPSDAVSTILNETKKEIESNVSISNRDAVVADLTNLASLAQQYYRKPTALGGGGESFIGWSIPSSLFSTSNGEYSTQDLSQTSVTLIGIGNVIGKNGTTNVKVTMIVGSDRIISTTINN